MRPARGPHCAAPLGSAHAPTPGSVHAPIRTTLGRQFAGSALNSCATVTAAGFGFPEYV